MRLEGGQSSIPSYGTMSWMNSGLSWNLINIKSPSSVIARELWDMGVMFVFAAPRTVFHPCVWSKASFELLFLIILWLNDYNMVPITGSWFLPRPPHTQTTLHPPSYFKCVCLTCVFTFRRSWNRLCKIGVHSSQNQTIEWRQVIVACVQLLH